MMSKLEFLIRDAPRPVKPQNAEVYYTDDEDRFVSYADIEWLKAVAALAPRRRARLCLHRNIEDPVHEMIIANHGSCYVPPHAHPYKEESMHVIEGAGRAVFFHDDGRISKVLTLASSDIAGKSNDAGTYFCRTPRNLIHGLRIDSEWFVFHEVAAGPFRADGNVFPNWAPKAPTDQDGVAWLDAAIARGNAL